MANYLHGIASISGLSEDFRAHVNVPDYVKHYGPKSNPLNFTKEKPSSEELLQTYELTFSLIEKRLDNIAETDLEKDIEIPNPVVKTKYEALLLLSQHQSWHNGQIAILKRVMNT